MAITPFKTFVAGEVLTASDLNNSFTQITDNGEDLGWPATKAKDFDGQRLILDSDADTSITADTDDQVDFEVGGADRFRMLLDSGVPDFRAEYAESGATAGPYISVYRNSSSAADNDFIGRFRWLGEDDGGNLTVWAAIGCQIADASDGSEDVRLIFYHQSNGAEAEVLRLGAGPIMRFQSADAGATAGPVFTLYRNSASPADEDLLGRVAFDGENDAGETITYAMITGQIHDASDGTEGGRIRFTCPVNGVDLDIFRIGAGASVQVRSDDAGAAAGPELSLWRNSASPADDDALAELRWDGNDSGGTLTKYVSLNGIALDVTDATEDGALAVKCIAAGVDTEVARFTGAAVLVGKTAADVGATAGIELDAAGTVRITRNAASPMSINRLGDDGQLLSFQQDGSQEGSISVSETTVAYNTFTGAHNAQWAAGHEPDRDPPIGTLLSTTGEEYERPAKRKPQLVKVKVTSEQADRAVYGVYGGRLEDGDVQVYALGTALVRVNGDCEPGDLLRASATPGVAEVQPDDAIRASTVGKVIGRPVDGLVACVLYSG